MIWRRFLVRSDSTVADLHEVIQILMGWGDWHLHQFKIRGRKYGVEKSGGIWFSTDADSAKLNSFRFRENERFVYEYNFYAQWEHEIRFEKTLPLDP